MRANYQDLMSNPARIEEILQEGASKARAIATPFIKELRQAVGLRSLGAATSDQAGKSASKSAKSGKAARFVSFRDEAGQFRFRFLAADGTELFCSVAFTDPKLAGAAMRSLQSADHASLIERVGQTDFNLVLGGEVLAVGVKSASLAEREQRLEALFTALEPTE
jgi:tryptophanyl-tRNA synthetase